MHLLPNQSLYSDVLNTSYSTEIGNKKIYNVALSLNNPEHWLDIFKDVNWNQYDGIILDAFHEAPEEWRLLPIYHNIISSGVSKNKIMWIDSGFSPMSEIQHISLPMFLNSYSIEKLQSIAIGKRTKMFLALARDPKVQRVKFILELLKNNLDANSVLTCGSSSDYSGGWDHLIPEDSPHKHKFPILLNSKKAGLHDVNLIEEEFTTCLFNIVLETGFEKIGPNSGWDRHFYTEKTGKPFFLEQIPLFLAKQGYVSVVRNLGFDLFDDIVDHSYDLIIDPEERIIALSKECLRLANLGLDHFKSLQGLQERFHYNRMHRKVVSDQLHTSAAVRLKSWFNSL